MRQTWHIFLKDARRLRYEIIVILVLTAAYAWSQGHWSTNGTVRAEMVNQAANMLRGYLLPIAWWFLASLAVHGEPLPGDRQFWVTRPYRWTSLLGSKLLFIAAFVSFPLLLADFFILIQQGLPPWEKPVGLLWHELAIFAVILLPMSAVACITATFARAVLVGLVTVVPILVFGRFFGPFLGTLSELSEDVLKIGGWTDIEAGIWGPLACLVLTSAALAIMILQYRARRTGVSRMIFAAAVLLILLGGRFLPGYPTFALQSPLFKSRVDTSSITAVFSPGSNPPPAVFPTSQNAAEFTRVTLPIRFDGVPPGTMAAVDSMQAEVTLPNGMPLNTWLLFGPAPPDTAWHEAYVERSRFEQLKNTPVRVHLTIKLTVLGNPHMQDMPLGVGLHRVPGVGMCELPPPEPKASWFLLNCRAPFRQPAYVLARFDGFDKEGPREQQRVDYSPFPAEFGINPISTHDWLVPKGATSVAFTTMQPVAHIQRELDIPNVQLTEFAN